MLDIAATAAVEVVVAMVVVTTTTAAAAAAVLLLVVCARAVLPQRRIGADGGFRLEVAEEGPRARPCSDGLIRTARRIHEAPLP